MNTSESWPPRVSGDGAKSVPPATRPRFGTKKHRSRRLLWPFAIVLPAAAAAWMFVPSSSAPARNYVLHEVPLGTLSIEVSERGYLESANNTEHFCELEGRSGGRSGGTAILAIKPPGAEVKKGDLLVELESSYLVDMVQAQRIVYQSTVSGVAKARTDVETAKKAIQQYEEGLFIQELKTLQAEASVAEENLRRARNSLRYTEGLYRAGYVNKLDVEAAQFAVRNTELLLDKQKTILDVHVNVTKQKTLTQLRGDLEAKQATLKSEEEKSAQEKARLDGLTAQLQKCKIYAKADGMVVYYEIPGRFGANEEDRIKEGSIVRERQKLIIIPDLKQMQVRVLVNESKLEGVRKGQPVSVRVDAFPDKVLAGRVEVVAAAPEQGAWYERDRRNYPVIIRLNESFDGLKPGMTAQTSILVNRISGALIVPVQCVRTADGNTFCYVLKPDGSLEERQVRLGPSDDKYVQVLEGLTQGEQVIQSPEATLPLKDWGRVGTAVESTAQESPRAKSKTEESDSGLPPGKGPGQKGEEAEDDRGPPPGKGPRKGGE